ncbi:NAD(P)-dependent dehydrogenase (short-subunit alcohol dehydrogenase family) [Nocardia transvalensis]|uniref:NAD(P)-dependent dehydrogenase (Short-subunit alcohol dehydrogenase family) n=1 Tax=Nocardia transvalensis TaxID=37333 RepID=A0A7W9PC87_9NOCA|nr:SDR family oxidoreductase [Nocardia transvalensis]MBB5913452.1 NAD(P)-dependent dehydrogenase (short-subunit alcohol dehydrogenase family) [Nocardia transvalensis]
MTAPNTSTTARVVVMGGSSGIGEATAALFAAGGAEVVVTGRSQDKLDAAVARIGGKTTAHRVDAGSQAEVDAFFAQAGTIDHLVISVSGSAGSGPFAELTLDHLAEGFDGKFWPHVRILKAALPHLDPAGSVTLVTAGSSRAAFPGTAGLAAINGALDAMVPPLAVELAPLRINAVSPGVIDTPWWDAVPEQQRRVLFDGIAAATPVGRVGRPEDIARAIHALATNEFISGVVLDATGGANLATGR